VEPIIYLKKKQANLVDCRDDDDDDDDGGNGKAGTGDVVVASNGETVDSQKGVEM
jgi:hypothetical protein